MKKGRYSEEQIIGVLKQMEAGRTVKDLARELGVSEATLYTWKSKYGGLDVNYLFTPRLGTGVFVRYLGAQVDLPAASDLKVGGFQGGVGLRVRF
jgi:hypothetical protein